MPPAPAFSRSALKASDTLRDAAVFITGGAGFLGSNLAIALVNLGAKVTILDAMIEGYGGNRFNLEPVSDRIKFEVGDIRDAALLQRLVAGQDFVVHLAAQVDHVLSRRDPFPDIDINVRGTTLLMEACRQHAPQAKVIYSGTRGEYGKASSLPVAETAPLQPLGLYEVTKLTGEQIVETYSRIWNLSCCRLRITNTYGPRAQMQHAGYGVVNWLLRLAIDGQTIPIFGDGKMLRDFLYVDDCVDAMLCSMTSDKAWGEAYNVGGGPPASFIELAEGIVAAAGSGRWELAPFSAERKAQEPGDFYCDISKIRTALDWSPTVDLTAGLRETAAFYRANRQHYWT